MLKRLDRWTRAFGSRVAQMGFFPACRYVVRRIGDRLLGRESGAISLGSRNVFKAYAMVDSPAVKVLPGTAQPKSMNWIIPRFSIGSGGHLNIFRMIAMLEKRGFTCRVFITERNAFLSAEQARQLINEHFVQLEAEVYLGADAMPPCHIVVATSWETAYWAQAFQAARHRLYFVQDFEPFFFAHGSEYAFAEQTYRMGFDAVTAGGWLAGKLAVEYGMRTQAFSFSFDKNRYHPLPRTPGPKRVFFYARHVTPRRGFELGLLALRHVHQQLPDVEFVLAGWDSSDFEVPFRHLNAGVVALDDLPALYAQCDVALVLSFTNLSLLPLELMACGCPVVSNRGANVEWLLSDGDNAILCEPLPESLANGVVRLLQDDALRKRVVEGGFATTAASDWEAEGLVVADFIETRLLSSELPRAGGAQ